MIYLKDHVPPHLHVFFGGKEAQISIATGKVLRGTLPRPKMKAVQRWLENNRDQVAYIWDEIRAGRYDGGMI
ncbi:DUF4160 domain-containing protein [Methylobacterium sp. Leaf456]|uniref:DUF4160 domain-containing protein n=1 Tax=Methylobacterium sp. Leaf456 TaxID=1736382 RepID=UPI000A5392B5|nr:DUF4160 domain-containing protein [Methylobacterium sp. Leaf456]